MDVPQTDWSELCPDILAEIAGRLRISGDFHSFGAVCKNWHYSLSLITQPRTLPLLHHGLPLTLTDNATTFCLSVNAVYLLRRKSQESSVNSESFVITVEEFNRGKLRLFHPLTRNQAQNGYRRLCLSDFRCFLIARAFILTRTYKRSGSTSYHKTLSYSYLDEYNKKHTIMIYFNPDYGELYWGRNLSKWVRLVCKGNWQFDDIVYFKEKLFAVDYYGRVYVFQNNNCTNVLCGECIVSVTDSIFTASDNDYQSRWRGKLVVDSLSGGGTLYLVHRGIRGKELDKIFVNVYKLIMNENSCKWEKVNSIGDDRVLFVSAHWCFFASTAYFPAYRGNSIFMLKDAFALQVGFIFLYEDYFFQGTSKELEVVVYHLEDGQFGPISAYPRYSDILWPPPAWLCTNAPQLEVQNKIG
ncbi:F-box protein SKIP23-like [Beta vulgaris subsp. vulgaris]|uniref:F-box protein SKIP23-like n=1 Tax=Beta vulgaris subsp. vulgaris TaxID=3555 RepID=UPI002037618F|nr:F-box protein SKIP23-like [Beta vulgaris subsp. vulgaris]